MKSAMTMALVILVSLAGVHGGQSQDLYFGGFNGTWEGTVSTRKMDLKTFDFIGERSDRTIRLVIADATARVLLFNKSKNAWGEVKPTQFRIESHKTNAIVYAVNSSSDVMDQTGSGGWVETWNFTITHKDKDSVYVEFAQAINNYLVPPTKDIARFIHAGGGELSAVR